MAGIKDGWKGQLEIALRNTIGKEIIDASGDGVAKPSQYVEGCVQSILGQIDFFDKFVRDSLIEFSDKMDWDEEKHLDAFNKCLDNIQERCVTIEHKYM